MKKFITWLLVLTLAITVTACGQSAPQPAASEAPAPAASEAPAPAPEPAPEPAADGGKIIVGFAQCKADESDWRKANTISMQETFTADKGYEFVMADSNNDAAKQVADVQGFIDQEVDYIVIAAVNMDGWDTVLTNAKNAGIPVILVDRTMSVSDDLFTSYIGPDFKVEGEKAVTWMEKRFGDSPAHIVNLQGQLGAGAQVGRSSALDDGVAKHDNWTLTARQTGNWSTDEAKSIMTTWIQQYPEINCVYAENDNMADGAIQALQEAGIKVGGDDGVAIISFDANRPYLQMTLEGLINCNVECNPLHGPTVEQVIKTIESGGTPDKRVLVPEEAFYYDTITQEIIDARAY